MSNGLYFILKAFFVLKIFPFFTDFFGYVGKRLDKKLRQTSKFVTSQTGTQTITINILPEISKSNGTQQ